MPADATHCRRIVRAHARTFLLASHFLTSDKRRATFALYAFCRVADDMVDTGDGDEPSRAARIDNYRARLDAALAGRPDDAVFREVRRAVERYRIPGRLLHELLDGVTRDCAPARYETWSELARYCEGVASSVGEMCTWVFGVDGDAATRDRAIRHARALGVAMQLTNILRDVGEDARRGRCYLPAHDLARVGLAPTDILRGADRANGNDFSLAADPRWHALMRFEIARARALYESAQPGIALLERDARRCATACALGYAKILGAIEQRGYDVFGGRARLGTADRLNVLLDAWRGVTPRAWRDDDAELEKRWA